MSALTAIASLGMPYVTFTGHGSALHAALSLASAAGWGALALHNHRQDLKALKMTKCADQLLDFECVDLVTTSFAQSAKATSKRWNKNGTRCGDPARRYTMRASGLRRDPRST